MCREYAVAVELKGVDEDVLTLVNECHTCIKCLTCGRRIPILSYGNGIAEDFAERVNLFVLSDKERVRG